MIESIRRSFAVPHIPTQHLLSAGTVVGFTWLLLQDAIHPLIVFLLQVYLTF